MLQASAYLHALKTKQLRQPRRLAPRFKRQSLPQSRGVENYSSNTTCMGLCPGRCLAAPHAVLQLQHIFVLLLVVMPQSGTARPGSTQFSKNLSAYSQLFRHLARPKSCHISSSINSSHPSLNRGSNHLPQRLLSGSDSSRRSTPHS